MISYLLRCVASLLNPGFPKKLEYASNRPTSEETSSLNIFYCELQDSPGLVGVHRDFLSFTPSSSTLAEGTSKTLKLELDASSTILYFKWLYGVRKSPKEPDTLYLFYVDNDDEDGEGEFLHMRLKINEDFESLFGLIQSHIPLPPSSVKVIINPKAGNQLGEMIYEEKVKPMLEVARVPHELYLTNSPGHAERLAEGELSRNGLTVIAMGGDGLVHELINGFINARVTPITLCVIPVGTGNAIAKSNGVLNPCSAIRKLLRGETKSIDLVKVKLPTPSGNIVRWSSTIVSWGFHAQVVRGGDSWRNWLGSSRFTLAAVSLLAAFTSYEGTLRLRWACPYNATSKTYEYERTRQLIDGPFQYFICGKQRQVDSGFPILPTAVANDGWLDVVLVKGKNRSELMEMLRQVGTASHLDQGSAEGWKCKSLQLELGAAKEGTHTICIDGELWEIAPGKQLELEIVQKSCSWIYLVA